MTTTEKCYRPFSNGTEFDIWQSANCQRCQKCNIEEAPECPADEALTLACFGDGQISEQIADYIGTQHRYVQDAETPHAYGFCTLNRVCNHFQPKS